VTKLALLSSIENPAKQLDAGVEERHVAANSGRIDQAADRAKTGLAALEPGDHAGLISDVHDHASDSIGAHRFQFGARGIQRTLRQVGDHDLPAVAEQGLGIASPMPEAPPVTIATPRSVMMACPCFISRSLPPAS
jgi:hypothetical protein